MVRKYGQRALAQIEGKGPLRTRDLPRARSLAMTGGSGEAALCIRGLTFLFVQNDGRRYTASPTMNKVEWC